MLPPYFAGIKKHMDSQVQQIGGAGTYLSQDALHLAKILRFKPDVGIAYVIFMLAV